MVRTVSIEITVAKDGTKRIAVDGVQGSSCEALTRPLEEVLSGAETTREYKPEFFGQSDVLRVGR